MPDDLYELAVAGVREIEQKRDAVAAEIEAANAMTPALGPHEVEGLLQRALAGLKDLGKLLKVADQRVARSALQTLIDRIDLTWEHQRYEKMVYSQLQRGVVRFGRYNLVQSG